MHTTLSMIKFSVSLIKKYRLNFLAVKQFIKASSTIGAIKVLDKA